MQLPVEVLKIFEITAMLTGAAYAVLAARRNRLCWIAGAVSSALAALLAGWRGLPMQSALQVFFVGMSVYGWLRWTRSAAQGELPVSMWPYPLAPDRGARRHGCCHLQPRSCSPPKRKPRGRCSIR